MLLPVLRRVALALCWQTVWGLAQCCRSEADVGIQSGKTVSFLRMWKQCSPRSESVQQLLCTVFLLREGPWRLLSLLPKVALYMFMYRAIGLSCFISELGELLWRKGGRKGERWVVQLPFLRTPIGLQNFTESFTNRIVVLTLCKSGINIVWLFKELVRFIDR